MSRKIHSFVYSLLSKIFRNKQTSPGDAGEGGLQLHGVLAEAPQLHHLVLRAGSQQTLVTVPGAAGHLDRKKASFTL